VLRREEGETGGGGCQSMGAIPAVKHPSPVEVAAAVLGLVFLAVTATRAAVIPIVHDEALTYNVWISQSLARIVLFKGPERVNNHLVNTLLAKGAVAIFGPEPFVLRLPNLLAHLSYLYFTWRLLARTTPPAAAVAGFVVVNANPFLLELFSLARGYGLALGFVAPALFFAVRSFGSPEGSRRDEALAAALLAAGILAQLVVLDVFVAAVASFSLFRLVRNRGSLRGRLPRLARESTPLVVASLLVVVTAGPIVALLKRGGQLYAGGSEGFWRDVVGSLVFLSELGLPGEAVRLTEIAIAATLLLLAILAIFFILPRAPSDGRAFLGLFAILVFASLAVRLQHVLFRANFPTDRMALVFFPLFALAFTTGLAAAGEAWPSLRPVIVVPLAFSAVLSLALTARRAEIPATSLWWYDADNVRILEDVSRRREGRSVRVAVEWLLEPSFNFYRRTRGLFWLPFFDRSGPWTPADFAVITATSEAEAARRGYTVLARFPVTGNLLLEPPKRARPSSQ
jgi:hypothetical protein